ncbi:MAG: hypothetical protein K0Q73_7826 [Paenibacillus sp.]|nr:hypothetical protein [Paenibacillus sp.]
MMTTRGERPMKEEIERLAADIEESRTELNRIGDSCREIGNELGQMSEKLISKSQSLDEKIVPPRQMMWV